MRPLRVYFIFHNYELYFPRWSANLKRLRIPNQRYYKCLRGNWIILQERNRSYQSSEAKGIELNNFLQTLNFSQKFCESDFFPLKVENGEIRCGKLAETSTAVESTWTGGIFIRLLQILQFCLILKVREYLLIRLDWKQISP